MKSFFQYLTEAPLPPPPPPGGMGMGGPLGGPGPGLPPPPPGGMGMGGPPPPPLGGPPGGDPMGGGQQPVPVKTIKVMDVWSILKEALADMDKYDELKITYERKKKSEPKLPKKKSALS